jgi:hypothetical protein
MEMRHLVRTFRLSYEEGSEGDGGQQVASQSDTTMEEEELFSSPTEPDEAACLEPVIQDS